MLVYLIRQELAKVCEAGGVESAGDIVRGIYALRPGARACMSVNVENCMIPEFNGTSPPNLDCASDMVLHGNLFPC